MFVGRQTDGGGAGDGRHGEATHLYAHLPLGRAVEETDDAYGTSLGTGDALWVDLAQSLASPYGVAPVVVDGATVGVTANDCVVDVAFK